MRIRTEGFSSFISEKDQKMAELSNALAHPLRVALVRFLKEKDSEKGLDNVTCNKELVEKFGYSQSSISQHVKILRECGLFTTKSEDKFTYYFLNMDLIEEVSEFYKDLLSK